MQISTTCKFKAIRRLSEGELEPVLFRINLIVDDVPPEDLFILRAENLKRFLSVLKSMLHNKYLNAYIRVPTAKNLTVFVASQVAHGHLGLAVFNTGVNFSVEVEEDNNIASVWFSHIDRDIEYLHNREAGWNPPNSKILLGRKFDEVLAEKEKEYKDSLHKLESIYIDYIAHKRYADSLGSPLTEDDLKDIKNLQ